MEPGSRCDDHYLYCTGEDCCPTKEAPKSVPAKKAAAKTKVMTLAKTAVATE